MAGDRSVKNIVVAYHSEDVNAKGWMAANLGLYREGEEGDPAMVYFPVETHSLHVMGKDQLVCVFILLLVFIVFVLFVCRLAYHVLWTFGRGLQIVD